MRIATVFRAGTANSHYRAILPVAELQRRGHQVAWPGDPSFSALQHDGARPTWDLLHLHQFIGPDDLDLVRRLRRRGVAVVWDTDDDAQALPKGSDSYRRIGGRRKVKKVYERTVEMASAAHLMTTTNSQLASVYRAAGVEHVAVIENYLAPLDPLGARPRHAGVVIGCVAASEHVGDIEQLGIPQALERLLRAHTGIRVVALGVDLRLRTSAYTHHPNVPIDRLLDVERQFDVGLAPLLDTAFNRSRSNVKLKEYAAAGAAWLASPVGPYVDMGEREGGRLVDDGAWFEAIEALALDGGLRSQLVLRGREWARRQTIAHGGRQWEAAFRSAIVRARREAR